MEPDKRGEGWGAGSCASCGRRERSRFGRDICFLIRMVKENTRQMGPPPTGTRHAHVRTHTRTAPWAMDRRAALTMNMPHTQVVTQNTLLLASASPRGA